MNGGLLKMEKEKINQDSEVERSSILYETVNEASPLLLSNASSFSYTESENHFGDSRRDQPVRRPFHYHPLRDSPHDSLREANSIAIYSRAKYYNKLCDPSDPTLKIPNHVLPKSFFFFGIPDVGPTTRKEEGKQSSLVTM